MVGLQRPQAEPGANEDNEEDSKMVCVAINDDFVLKQDMLKKLKTIKIISLVLLLKRSKNLIWLQSCTQTVPIPYEWKFTCYRNILEKNYWGNVIIGVNFTIVKFS